VQAVIEQAVGYAFIVGLGYGAIRLAVWLGRELRGHSEASGIPFARSLLRPALVPVGILIAGFWLGNETARAPKYACRGEWDTTRTRLFMAAEDSTLSRTEEADLQLLARDRWSECDAEATAGGRSVTLAAVVVLLVAYASGRAEPRSHSSDLSGSSRAT